jgi:hypothetical protein
MGEHRRKADGRRVFSTEFKRTAVQRILTGEKTLAELSRELDISPSVIRNWKRFSVYGAEGAVIVILRSSRIHHAPRWTAGSDATAKAPPLAVRWSARARRST